MTRLRITVPASPHAVIITVQSDRQILSTEYPDGTFASIGDLPLIHVEQLD